MDGGCGDTTKSAYRGVRWSRGMRYGDIYHPALACGFWLVLACMIFLAVAYFIDFIPQDMERVVILLWGSLMVSGGIVTFYGAFKSNDKGAYPCLIGLIASVVLLLCIWFITR